MTSARRYIFALTFISGMCIMAVEMTASRIMAPYFGTSHYVWTNIIGVILAALALGYWLGGRLSERSPKLETLLSIIIMASVLLLAIPALAPLFGSRFFMLLFSGISPMGALLAQSFIATTITFFLPIMMLGMVSPFIIKLLSLGEEAMGDVSGKVFAFGTIGSFLGTFLPAIVTVPMIGSRRTIVLFAFILFAMAVAGFARRKAFAIGIIPFAALALPIPVTHSALGRTLTELESPYQYVKVVEGPDGMRFLQFNESIAVQSAYRRDEPLSPTAAYYDVMSYVPELVAKRPLRVLNIGLAGGTVARNIKDLYGDAVEVVGVEIDREVVRLGEQYLALDRPGIEVHVDDGRMFLRRDESVYDVIIIDAYSNQMTIPFHLATKEFFELVREHLAPGGVVAMNVNDISLDGRIMQSIGKTLRTQFPAVMATHIDGALNYLVIAGDQLVPERMAKTSIGPLEMRMTATASARGLRAFLGDQGQILTDDLAPLESMADSMIWMLYRGIN